MMKPIEEIATAIADATGMNRRLAELVCEDLRKHGLVADDDAENAARLLIGFAGGLDVVTARRALERYWHLPFESSTHTNAGPVGGFTSFRQNVMDSTPTFGAALTDFIRFYIEAETMDYRMDGVTIACGPGMTCAWIATAEFSETGRISTDFHFSTVPMGGGILPDDAPRARVERSIHYPGEIFQVLREVIGGKENAPLIFVHSDAVLEEWRAQGGA